MPKNHPGFHRRRDMRLQLAEQTRIQRASNRDFIERVLPQIRLATVVGAAAFAGGDNHFAPQSH